MAKKIHEDWLKHLTNERRAAFEKTGEFYVRNTVKNNAYGSREANLAGLAWLAEQDALKKRAESCRYWALFIVAFLTLIAATIAVLPTRNNTLPDAERVSKSVQPVEPPKTPPQA